MRVLDVFKTKDFGWLGLVAARRGTIDDCLERISLSGNSGVPVTIALANTVRCRALGI
jgi:hypothetical protein